MKNFNILALLFASFIAYSFLSKGKDAIGAGGLGWNMYEITQSTTRVIAGPAFVGAIITSSGTEDDVDQYSGWVIAVDSFTIPNFTLADFSTGAIKTPPVVFRTTAATGGFNLPYKLGPEELGEYGVFFSSWVTVIKSGQASGLARRAWIRVRRGAIGE